MLARVLAGDGVFGMIMAEREDDPMGAVGVCCRLNRAQWGFKVRSFEEWVIQVGLAYRKQGGSVSVKFDVGDEFRLARQPDKEPVTRELARKLLGARSLTLWDLSSLVVADVIVGQRAVGQSARTPRAPVPPPPRQPTTPTPRARVQDASEASANADGAPTPRTPNSVARRRLYAALSRATRVFA